jgi:hypothetical protein
MDQDFLRSTFAMAAKLEIDMKGAAVTFQRTGSPDVPAQAKISGYIVDNLVGDIQQARREIRVMASDIPFDPPLKRGDRAKYGGRVLFVESVDAGTMELAGVLIVSVTG